jgi:two-component system sensor histidine kinase KdpD
MATPVHDNGQVCGSLVVASYTPGRVYSAAEQDALVAFAEHATLAISDARNHAAMLEAQRAKEMFLAMVSHELKTPLTVIMGSLDTLRRHHDRLTSEQHDELLGAAADRGRQLERLIDSLLRGARAELAGERVTVDLAQLLRAATAGFGQVRQMVLEGVEPLSVTIDASAFRDVLGILLENAVAHSPDDTPIRVACTLRGDDLGVRVSNVGSLPDGLDPSTLFLPFHRGHSARSSGVGLGLYIAARLAESLRGRLDVSAYDGEVALTLHCSVGREPTPVTDGELVPG